MCESLDDESLLVMLEVWEADVISLRCHYGFARKAILSRKRNHVWSSLYKVSVNANYQNFEWTFWLLIFMGPAHYHFLHLDWLHCSKLHVSDL